MMPRGVSRYRRASDFHLVLGVVAITISLLVHVVGMYFFSDMILTGSTQLRQRASEWLKVTKAPVMRMETLPTDPQKMSMKVPGEMETPSYGAIDPQTIVETLSQSASPVITVPPEVPREEFAPGKPHLHEITPDPATMNPWMPRQEIAQIFDQTIQDEVATLARRKIPEIERVSQAADVVPSVDLLDQHMGHQVEPPRAIELAEIFDTAPLPGTFKPPLADEAGVAALEGKPGTEPLTLNGQAATGETGLPPEELQKELEKKVEEARKGLTAPEITEEERKAREAQAQIATLRKNIKYVPVEDRLAVGVETFVEPAEPEWVYFRIGVESLNEQALPVLPKDIVFVQDVSGSMTEERMTFCRRGLLAALESLNPEDRFNVVAFRDTFETCFPTWGAVDAANLKKAQGYINGLRAFGATDLFGSLRLTMRLDRDPRRPMVAIVITDGEPTFGITQSTKIIEEFSKLNEGIVSIFMYGVHKKANVFLMDLLAYSNRGASSVMMGNRWDIPAAFVPIYTSVKNPLMADVTAIFDTQSQSEVYPRHINNLYLGKQIILYGRCPAGTQQVVFQLRGLAGQQGYDSVFRLNLPLHAKKGVGGIRHEWAKHRMYQLMVQHATSPDQSLWQEIEAISASHQIEIPYVQEFK